MSGAKRERKNALGKQQVGWFTVGQWAMQHSIRPDMCCNYILQTLWYDSHHIYSRQLRYDSHHVCYSHSSETGMASIARIR